MKKIELSKYFINFLFNVSINKINVEKKDDYFLLSYIKDKEKIFTKLKFQGNKNIIWSNIDGEWRCRAFDPIIEYNILNNTLTIKEIYSKDNIIAKKYKFNNYKK